MLRKIISRVMEHSGKILIVCAIICEIKYQADPYLVLMTAASLMVMLAEQIKIKK